MELGNTLPRILMKLAPLSAIGICLYAFVIPLGNSPAYFVSAVLIVPAALLVFVRSELRGTPVIVLSIGLVIYVIALGVIAQRSGVPGRHLSAGNNFYFISLAPFVAIQIIIAARHIPYERLAVIALQCAMLGGAVILAVRAKWSAGVRLFAHYADGLGSANRNYVAIIAVVTLFASMSCIVFDLLAGVRNATRCALLLVAFLVTLLSAIALVSVQSRTSTLAAVVALAAWSISCLAILMRNRRGKLAVAGLAAVVVGAIAVVLLNGPVAERFAAHGGIVASLRLYADVLLGQSEAAAAGDERMLLFRLAMELIAQKPWFGWAPDPSSLVMEYGKWEFIQRDHLNHFHNAYLEFIVAIGGFGASLFLLLVVVVAQDVRRARDLNAITSYEKAALYSFAISIFVFFAVVGMAESVHRVEFATQTMILTAAFILARGSLASAVDPIVARAGGKPTGAAL